MTDIKNPIEALPDIDQDAREACAHWLEHIAESIRAKTFHPTAFAVVIAYRRAGFLGAHTDWDGEDLLTLNTGLDVVKTQVLAELTGEGNDERQ